MATASQRLSEQLRETIEEEVATGKLKPGTHLDELELAARFGVSRTPIRETLSLLAGEGLVEIRPRRGAVVAQLSPARLVEMFEVMAELEAMSARLAARRIKDDALARLQAMHERCEQAAQAGDPDAYFYANEEFHQAVYRAAQNEYLIEQAFSLQRKLRPYRRLQLRVRNRLQRSLAEHQAVLDAIRANEPEQAAQAMRGHVMVQGDRFADLLVELRSFENAEA
ncbi:MAG: GntR family transcriptional regulator [Roseateles depolymerans]|uniref:GntR family transcriptional regulator n=1 Tax=Roseateles depolymerans TaxID=76731 RepID=A0A2W5FNJ6_9BURK|nr:MAG: GntR family transcriptional regulator [Roseateles depolymerans]